MAITMQTMREKVAVTTVTWQDEQVDVGYRPSAFTIEAGEEAALAGERKDLDGLAKMLEPIVAWWDVLEAEGGPRLPVTYVTLKRMPLGFLTGIMAKIREDMNPPAQGASAGT